MTKLIQIFLLILIFIPSYLFAQEDSFQGDPKNSVFLEIGGNAGQYAFNYGRTFHQNGNVKLIGSLGFSFWADPIEGSTIWKPALPVELVALVGKKRHHLELGVGFTSFIESQIDSEFTAGGIVQTEGDSFFAALIPFRIGYRYQKPNKGFFFRIGYTPFFSIPTKMDESWDFQAIHAGIGLGYNF
ncbi:hypothetical protein [Algoriphagus confluentis]|uniref:Outer membrane protein beta-barrel domain-containing protein n=1 Tax=Algoriphagus confluentis TaxID=1697556 RepID=A0ABQ6PRL8_9BACT|nr:hypothetical protein Aconfl_29440 [Algoriphagus confluentis]